MNNQKSRHGYFLTERISLHDLLSLPFWFAFGLFQVPTFLFSISKGFIKSNYRPVWMTLLKINRGGIRYCKNETRFTSDPSV